jgi:hypothetical protein
MADYLTIASQYFGESMIKGATVVAGGITTYVFALLGLAFLSCY